MITLVYILTAVYILAINFYSFTLFKSQKNAEESCQNQGVYDGKILITAVLGGALGVIISSIANKHRNKSLLIMVIMPVILALNGYLIYLFISSGVNYIFASPNY